MEKKNFQFRKSRRDLNLKFTFQFDHSSILPEYQRIIMGDESESTQQIAEQPHCRGNTPNNRLNAVNLFPDLLLVKNQIID